MFFDDNACDDRGRRERSSIIKTAGSATPVHRVVRRLYTFETIVACPYDRLAVDSKLPFVCVEVIDVTVDFNGWVIRSDLLAHEPSEMNDG